MSVHLNNVNVMIGVKRTPGKCLCLGGVSSRSAFSPLHVARSPPARPYLFLHLVDVRDVELEAVPTEVLLLPQVLQLLRGAFFCLHGLATKPERWWNGGAGALDTAEASTLNQTVALGKQTVAGQLILIY